MSTKINESMLRTLIRAIIIECCGERGKPMKEEEELLGEPDLSAEDERSDEMDPKYIDEFSSIAGGSIRGYMGPLGAGKDQWNTVGVPDSEDEDTENDGKKQVYGW